MTPGRITMRQGGDAKAHGLQILSEGFQPGADTGETALEHIGNEGGAVILGETEVTLGAQAAVLRAGEREAVVGSAMRHPPRETAPTRESR